MCSSDLEIQKTKKPGNARILVRCDCGLVKWLDEGSFSRCLSKSCHQCGLKRNHVGRGHLIVENRSVELLQKRATAIFQRCNNPNDKAYRNYGGRGIECRFGSVKELVDYLRTLPEWDSGKEIDRILNNGHYERGNIKFSTRKEQLANRRNTLFVSWKGKKILAQDWAENPYIRMSTVCKYVHMGMTGDRKSTRLNSSHIPLSRMPSSA